MRAVAIAPYIIRWGPDGWRDKIAPLDAKKSRGSADGDRSSSTGQNHFCRSRRDSVARHLRIGRLVEYEPAFERLICREAGAYHGLLAHRGSWRVGACRRHRLPNCDDSRRARAVWVTMVRPRREDRASIWSHPLADIGGARSSIKAICSTTATSIGSALHG